MFGFASRGTEGCPVEAVPGGGHVRPAGEVRGAAGPRRGRRRRRPRRTRRLHHTGRDIQHLYLTKTRSV